jgi:hypothetical protein
MRTDVRKALRGRRISFIGANRELRLLVNYLYDNEEVHDLLACRFGDTGGRALLVVTDERVLVYKDGWIFKNSQAMSYEDIRTVEVRTGLFTGKIKFKGEGMSFEISKVGRFAAEHAVKLIRSRIGSRFDAWEQQRLMRQNPHTAATPVQEVQETPTPVQPKPFYETDEPLTLDQFLVPTPKEEKPAASLLDELERLQALQEKGLLTPEEYTAAKQKLLS